MSGGGFVHALSNHLLCGGKQALCAVLILDLRLDSPAALGCNLVYEGLAETLSTQWLMFALAHAGSFCCLLAMI